VLDADGAMIMRNPFSMTNIGRSFASNDLFTRISSERSGEYEYKSLTDGITRLYSFTRVGNLPLFVVVGLSKEELFRTWRGKAEILGFTTLVLALTLATLGLSLAGELRRRREAENELRLVASTDGLTGLYNRRSFDEFAVREWTRSVKTKSSFSLLIVDVDNFKQLNDLFGHQRGDEALKVIASRIQTLSGGPSDLAFRYGGEEFVIILPGASLDEAIRVAENLRQRVADALIGTPEGCCSSVTVSIGIASRMPEQGNDISEAIAAADKALYEAKAQGRNRVKVDSSTDCLASVSDDHVNLLELGDRMRRQLMRH
jgi:diguanylate cyclase (GGDEF)-like protein